MYIIYRPIDTAGDVSRRFSRRESAKVFDSSVVGRILASSFGEKLRETFLAVSGINTVKHARMCLRGTLLQVKIVAEIRREEAFKFQRSKRRVGEGIFVVRQMSFYTGKY